MPTQFEQVSKLADLDSEFMRLLLHELAEGGRDGVLWCILLADYAHSVARNFDRALDLGVFQVIEEMMQEEPIGTAVATGFWEAMLSLVDRKVVDLSRLAQVMGPKSKAYCRAWNKFCGISVPELEDTEVQAGH